MRPQDGGPDASTAAVSEPGRTLGLDPFELCVIARPDAALATPTAVRAWTGAAVGQALLIGVRVLVTNSVRHADALRVAVSDRGRSGTIARRPPDLGSGGCHGLNVVRSRRWGVDRDIGTRVSAELALQPWR